MLKFHDSTVRKRLKMYDLFLNVTWRKNLLFKKNMAEQFKFSKLYVNNLQNYINLL